MKPKLKRIHINQHHIRANNKGDNKPVITVKCGKQNVYGNSVIINGESMVVYPDKPLSCGARVWIETHAEVDIYDEHEQFVCTL